MQLHRQLHPWDLSPGDAIRLQTELEPEARLDLPPSPVRLVGGTDVAYLKEDGLSLAVVCVLDFPSLKLVEWVAVRRPTPFPYIPGLLSFREVPVLLEAFTLLKAEPDLIFVDGHGRAHPRRFGIACHLGLWLGRPTIGIGKSLLCGCFHEPGMHRGDWSPLVDRGEEIGRALRTRTGVKPIFVSRGYGLPLQQCVDWTLLAGTRYRLPEPIRWADRLAAGAKRSVSTEWCGPLTPP